MSLEFKYLEKRAAAGSPSAMNRVAVALTQGSVGVEKNFEVAVDWIKKAASLQNATALHNLSFIYRHGILGFEKDGFKADYWMAQALKAEKNPKALSDFHHLAEEFGSVCPDDSDFGGIADNLLGALLGKKEKAKIPTNIFDAAMHCFDMDEKMGSLAFVLLKMLERNVQNNACNGCGKWAINICSGCKTQKYCSLQCQKNAWPKHKLNCCKKGL
jgi:hypothetical protein